MQIRLQRLPRGLLTLEGDVVPPIESFPDHLPPSEEHDQAHKKNQINHGEHRNENMLPFHDSRALQTVFVYY